MHILIAYCMFFVAKNTNIMVTNDMKNKSEWVYVRVLCTNNIMDTSYMGGFGMRFQAIYDHDAFLKSYQDRHMAAAFGPVTSKVKW